MKKMTILIVMILFASGCKSRNNADNSERYSPNYEWVGTFQGPNSIDAVMRIGRLCEDRRLDWFVEGSVWTDLYVKPSDVSRITTIITGEGDIWEYNFEFSPKYHNFNKGVAEGDLKQ